MGAGAAKKRQTTRKAGKTAKRTSASPAPISPASDLDTAAHAGFSAADRSKDNAHAEPGALTAPGKKPRGTKNSNKPPPAAATTPTRVTRITQSCTAPAGDAPEPQHTTEQDTSIELVELDTESTPKASTCPERKAKAEFNAMLSQITEEPDFNEGDRTIGGYKWRNDEWETWKRGSDEYDDEYEEDDSVGDDDGFETSTTVSTASQVTGNVRVPDITANKSKGKSSNSKTTAGKSKRKERSDTDSEDKCDGDFCTHWIVSINIDFSFPEEFTIPIDVLSKAKDIRNVLMVSSEVKWGELEEKIARTLNVFTPNLRAQYTLSTDKKGAIPIALTSQTNLETLHIRLASLIFPGRNADGSRSRHKKKEVTVYVTDKNDDNLNLNTLSGGNGKVSQ